MNDEELAAAALEVDPGRSNVLLFVGTKGSGKSEAARRVFDMWPHDRVVIDVTGDARPDDKYTLPMTAPFPSQIPDAHEAARELGVDEDELHGRVTVWARVDPRSSTYEHDQDQALGLGLFPRHRDALVWHDEYGQAGTAQKISPNMKLALNSSRHYYLTLLLACPRPRHIPTLTIQQADRVFIFRLPNPADREVIAENAGISLPTFERQYHENQRRHRHAFLLWDAQHQVLLNCPPLPGVRHRGPRS